MKKLINNGGQREKYFETLYSIENCASKEKALFVLRINIDSNTNKVHIPIINEGAFLRFQ